MPGFPAVHADLREQLIAALDHQRSLVRLAAYGLTDDQARLVPTVSALSVGGLLKHLAGVERAWTAVVTGRTEPFDPQRMADHAERFRMTETETLAELLDRYAAAAADTDRELRARSLDDPVPVPHDVPWFPKDVDTWSVAWIILHLVEETARHAGHADIVREGVDGATWLPLMAAADGLPPNPFFSPWTPAQGTAAPSSA